MKSPLVSIVMPVMNSGRYLGETLYSFFDQVHENFELIVVDGGSTDDTLDIVEEFNSGDIRVIKLAPGLGIAPAMNAGIDAAKGNFIARMDADDLIYRWRLHDQVKFLLAEPEIDLIGTGVDTFGEHEGSFRSPKTHKDILDGYLVNNPFFHPTIMFRRKLADNGLYRYNETQAFEEDYELWGRLIPQVACANLDQSSIRYRIRGNSTQWDPRKYRYKTSAIQGFCGAFNIHDESLIEALVEFQCAAFIRPHHYHILRNYALEAERNGKPRLGWIHRALIKRTDYAEFTRWFRNAKGWSN